MWLSAVWLSLCGCACVCLCVCMFVHVYVCAWSAYEGREGNEGCVSTAEGTLEKRFFSYRHIRAATRFNIARARNFKKNVF